MRTALLLLLNAIVSPSSSFSMWLRPEEQSHRTLVCWWRPAGLLSTFLRKLREQLPLHPVYNPSWKVAQKSWKSKPTSCTDCYIQTDRSSCFNNSTRNWPIQTQLVSSLFVNSAFLFIHLNSDCQTMNPRAAVDWYGNPTLAVRKVYSQSTNQKMNKNALGLDVATVAKQPKRSAPGEQETGRQNKTTRELEEANHELKMLERLGTLKKLQLFTRHETETLWERPHRPGLISFHWWELTTAVRQQSRKGEAKPDTKQETELSESQPKLKQGYTFIINYVLLCWA